MAYTEQQLKDAARKALAAGDTAAAKRLIDAARAAGASAPQSAQVSPAQGAQIVPSGFEIGTGELQTAGPGPTGRIDPALYEMGAIGRRFVPGQRPGQAMNPRTGTSMPEVVRAADGTEFYLDPATGGYVDRTGMKMREDAQTGPLKALGVGYVRGYSVNSADEVAGLGGDRMREQARAMQDANQEAYPVLSAVGEIAGAVANPINRVLPIARTVWGATGLAGLTGAVDGFMRGEGDATNRMETAAESGATSALFALPLSLVARGISKGYEGFAKQAAERPTLQNLKLTKDAAYRAVDNSGEVFTGAETAQLAQDAKALLNASFFDDIADPQTAAALRILDARANQDLPLTQLDKIRQALWTRYNRSDEPLILGLIGQIDDLIDSRAGASSLMKAARDANSTFRRVEMLDDAFRKAELQTAATGSGGNILNKYRQAVEQIVDNPQKAKWFAPEQIAVMESFVRGGNTENALRRIGKMAPGGNGLMTFLNFYAATLDPSMIAATVAAQAAKTSADNMATAGREGVLDAAAGFTRPAPTGPGLNPLAVGAGVATDNLLNER